MILPNGTRYANYSKWESAKNLPYDYEKNGLLKRIMSRHIMTSTNLVLNTILKFCESAFIFIMKYVDILNNFKDPHWKNR